MNIRKHLLEALTLILAAVLCAVVANAVASHERKVALVGTYPNAMNVPQRTAEPTPTITQTSTNVPTAMPVSATATTATATPLTTTTPPSTSTSTTRSPATATTATARTTTAPPSAPKLTPTTTAAAAPPQPATASASNDSPTARFPPHPDKQYVELHGDDVAWLHAKGALFIDARRTSVYEQGHIAGARSMSVWESDVDAKVNKLYEERSDPRQQLQPIVVYCSGGDCEDSHMLAEKLWGAQFNAVYVYKDGFPDWQKRGGAIHTGSAP
jgi:rhodanese-related sulfurtransferase